MGIIFKKIRLPKPGHETEHQILWHLVSFLIGSISEWAMRQPIKDHLSFTVSKINLTNRKGSFYFLWNGKRILSNFKILFLYHFNYLLKYYYVWNNRLTLNRMVKKWKRIYKRPNQFLNIYCQNHVYGNTRVPPEASY